MQLNDCDTEFLPPKPYAEHFLTGVAEPAQQLASFSKDDPGSVQISCSPIDNGALEPIGISSLFTNNDASELLTIPFVTLCALLDFVFLSFASNGALEPIQLSF